ncbi:single-stranded DNA-binding protein [Harryflintia acetispora]|uniref:single-stranded DNA-binding protein n=1 Tax=Harryflintia acetispora TaxID=1849041 RepID=UPI0018994226|nr:single-stranded DNA-binding protein [Harryflintia acetispora]
MINKAILVGRLTADPELRSTQSGLSVVSFTVAIDRRYSNGGERQADFINCVAWRQTAEFISKYFNKGKLIGVEGSIQTRNYEDKQGNKRTAVEVVVDNASFIGSKAENGGGSPSYTNFDAPASQPTAQPVSYQSGSVDDFQEITSDEDLPF